MTARETHRARERAAETAEGRRLDEDTRRERNWKRWGSYLAERQWGTVREDYSADGTCWEYFPHDQARSRAYRWGEDGLLGICDREARLCFALALWNGRDPILKERLFGLSGPEGNHGEDVKECYYYLDATPTHSYMKALYKYPQSEFPYARLVEENRNRGRSDPEFEILDTGAFDGGRYFDVTVEYAKASPDDLLIRVSVANRGPEAARLELLPTLWFRNTWSWGCAHEGCWAKPRILLEPDGTLLTDHESLGRFCFAAGPDPSGRSPEWIFTENETNAARIFGAPNAGAFVKDAFHDYVIGGRTSAVNPRAFGTKAAARYRLDVPAGGEIVVRLRLTIDLSQPPSGAGSLPTLGGLPAAGIGSAIGGGSPSTTTAEAGTRRESDLSRPPSGAGPVPTLGGLPAGTGPAPDGGSQTSKSAQFRTTRESVPSPPREATAIGTRSMTGPPGIGTAAAHEIGPEFDRIFETRIREADEFYDAVAPAEATDEERRVLRQGYAGLLWSKQFYHYVVREWLEGDPEQPTPPESRWHGRNSEWTHLFNRDIISMPDKWEYPWYAAWDLAFHMIPMAKIDPEFAKQQLVLFLREWYMHPNGQLPAYEFAFGDVNPPVHAWAAWRVYKMTGEKGRRDLGFLERVFHKLLLNFTWWVNRKDLEGKNLFAGGFLGLDNIGVFDRSKPLPTGGSLQQADGTAWMAFYCATMLSMAFKLASRDRVYEDLASKFFEHFVRISDAMNTLGGTGLWDEEDGFYYDQLHVDGQRFPLKIRSMVGLIPLFAVELLEQEPIDRLPGFKKRMEWFLENRKDLAGHISYMSSPDVDSLGHRLLAIPSRERLVRVLRYLLDENEFLSPYGIRSLSRIHRDKPYVLRVDGHEYRVGYEPGESESGLFGGNSNWRGPIWFPVNYLLVEALERYHHFYGEGLRVECPTGSGQWMNLEEVAREIGRRHAKIFLPDAEGRRPLHGGDPRYARDPDWKDLVLFHEYFHGETGRGVGASHQTGWTTLALRFIEDLARERARPAVSSAAPPKRAS